MKLPISILLFAVMYRFATKRVWAHIILGGEEKIGEGEYIFRILKCVKILTRYIDLYQMAAIMEHPASGSWWLPLRCHTLSGVRIVLRLNHIETYKFNGNEYLEKLPRPYDDSSELNRTFSLYHGIDFVEFSRYCFNWNRIETLGTEEPDMPDLLGDLEEITIYWAIIYMSKVIAASTEREVFDNYNNIIKLLQITDPITPLNEPTALSLDELLRESEIKSISVIEKWTENVKQPQGNPHSKTTYLRFFIKSKRVKRSFNNSTLCNLPIELHNIILRKLSY